MVLSLVMRNALVLVAIGLGLGIPLALLGGRLVATQLYGVRIYDPFTISAAVLILAASAALAGLIPARRAASIEPMHALRTE
jgi:ABC-type antimicrobial peptide transport system permease subunit